MNFSYVGHLWYLPRYPAPSGLIARAAMPSESSLSLTAVSVQSNPSASRGKASDADLALGLSASLRGEFLASCLVALAEGVAAASDCADNKIVSKSIPGKRLLRAVSKHRTRSSAAVRLLRVSWVRVTFRLYAHRRLNCKQGAHAGRSLVHYAV